jgi:hypothetical protein
MYLIGDARGFTQEVLSRMPRTKIPTAIRMDPDVKAEAMRRAAEERRSFAAHLEWLIMQDAKAHPAEQTPPKLKRRQA